MSEEMDLMMGGKSTPGKKICVKNITRELSEGLGKYSISEYVASNVTNNYY
jgi:hypothetical protein